MAGRPVPLPLPPAPRPRARCPRLQAGGRAAAPRPRWTVGARRGRGRRAWPGEAGPGRRLGDSRAAAAEAAGWPCARAGRRLGSGGSACGSAARAGRPRLARRLQRGRRAPRSRGDREQVIPAGARRPPELAGREPPLPGAAAGGGRRRAPDLGPGSPRPAGSEVPPPRPAPSAEGKVVAARREPRRAPSPPGWSALGAPLTRRPRPRGELSGNCCGG